MKIIHIALNYADEEQADTFFGKVLGLKQIKKFMISCDFSDLVFGVKKNTKVKVYSDNKTTFEIFITPNKTENIFEHICLQISNKEELIKRCHKYCVETIKIERNGNEYLFIRDFSGYLYEIKEIN